MYLENLVFDALDPRRLGLFWEAVVDGEQLTDEPDGYETRLAVEGGPVLDLCFQPVAEPSTEPARLRLDLAGDAERLLGLGAQRLGDVLADPEGNPVRVVAGLDAGPVAALSLDSADPDRDAAFWAWLTGWTRDDRTLRHPSSRGFVLDFRPEPAPKGAAKNRLHLDVRLETGDDPDAYEAAIAERGGRRDLHPEWGELPWRSYADPSGNEFCLLPARVSPE